MPHQASASRVVLSAMGACIALLIASALPAQSPAALDGIVVDADTERPLAGVRISVGREEATLTDARGRFRIEGLAPGVHTVRAEAVGFGSEVRSVEVTGDGAWLRVALRPHPFEISGVVATGNPLRGAAPFQPAQAYDRDALTRRAAMSFGEMLDGEPGIAMRSLGPATGRPVIRGLDGDRVAVLENGQRMGDISETAPDHTIALDPLTADRVEVVRGPASLLYGTSALGGVVNLLREDIPRTWLAGLSGVAGAQGATANRLGAGSGSLVYGDEQWAVTGRLTVRESGNLRAPGTDEGVLEGTYSSGTSGGAGFGWRSDVLHAGMAFDVFGQTFGIPDELDDPVQSVEIRSGRQRVTALADWEGEGFVRNVELRAAGARFFQQEVEMEIGADDRVAESVEHEFTRHTAEITLTAGHGRAGPVSEGAVGVTAFMQALGASGEGEFHPDGRTLSAAAFLFQEMPISDRLALQAGGRLELGRTDAVENRHFPTFRDRRSAVTFSGSLGLNYAPSPALEIGAQLARAHRAPRVEELYADGPHLGAARYEVGDADLRNEIGHGADIFVRRETSRMQAELALFANRIDHFVFPRATGETDEGTGLPIVRWTGAAALFLGGEASVETLLTEALSIRLTGDYVRASRRDSDATPLPHIPPARLTASTRYDGGAFWTGGRIRLAAAQNRVFREDPTEGYVLLDLQAGLRAGPQRDHVISLRLDNALDTVYRDHLSRVEGRRFPMPGRNLSAVYRWSF